MNKKFSTLMMMALIGAGTLSSSAFAADAADAVAAKINGAALKAVADPATNKTWANGPYFIVADADGDGVAEAGEYALQVSLVNDKLVYAGYKLQSEGNTEKVNELSWKFAETVTTDQFNANTKTYSYTLTNVETGTLLTAKSDGTLVEVPSDCSHDGKTKYAKFTKSSATTQFKNKDVLGLNIGSGVLPLEIGENITIGSATGSKLILCTLETWTMPDAVAVKEFNDVKGGAGFNFTFSLDNKNEWANDNLSSLNLTAIQVVNDFTWGTDDMFTIPAGVYFVTDYPASVKESKFADEKEFMASTFLAVDPDVCNATSADDRKAGIGFGLKTVKGSDLNYYTKQKDDQASVKGEVYVKNVCFDVIKPDMLGNPEVYNLKATARLLTDASKTAHVEKTVYLGSLVASNKNYLATTNEASKALALKTANTTLYDVTELLKSEDVPSIYTIQFVSELYKDGDFAGEKGQYLTVGQADPAPYVAAELFAVEDMDATDPLFQFVITAVDKEKKQVTFANRLLSYYKFTVSLYKNEDGSYTVYSNNLNQALNVETFDDNEVNSNVTFEEGYLQGTKVVLTPVTIEDKFASFVNRTEDAGLVTFEFAKNIDDTPAFYVGATTLNGVIQEEALRAYDNSKYMTQFELVKVGDPSNENKPYSVTNSYVYKNGARVLTSTAQDTVSYYKYYVKVFGEDKNGDAYYLTENYKLEAIDPDFESSASSFIIKNNMDGSVSLMYADNINHYSPYAYVSTTTTNKANAWTNNTYLELKHRLSNGLKTFMVGEDPVYSYEAVPQHVSFEAVRGGFLTKDANNDARLAIANVAAEDLTFWLDTVHSDRNIPSFYILKNGAFMYNASDSADYNIVNKERFNIDKTDAPKLIFKAGELVTSDTLRTMVDGQSVLVAEKDNAPKKIKGGLNNFQFQIVQAEKGSNEYVIRQLNGGAYEYVCQVNNYLTIGIDKDNAYRFVIEKQAAPTANEGIEVSEVKVIAGNGQITIMGAAGKKVVVSNILGKVVANQMITTDNATIAVPAGIVAVAVEGEAAVKAIVK